MCVTGGPNVLFLEAHCPTTGTSLHCVFGGWSHTWCLSVDVRGWGGRSGRQKAATRRNMRREERVTVQGPVKEHQPDGMSHGGGKCRCLRGGCRRRVDGVSGRSPEAPGHVPMPPAHVPVLLGARLGPHGCVDMSGAIRDISARLARIWLPSPSICGGPLRPLRPSTSEVSPPPPPPQSTGLSKHGIRR